MSTITTHDLSLVDITPEWLPFSPYRVSVEQYEAMVALGMFRKRDRVQLINGVLVTKMTDNPPHAVVCDAVRHAVEPKLPQGWCLRPDKPIRIAGYNEPEPDLVVARGTFWDYEVRHPEPADIALVIEVSDSSLLEDRAMAPIFGRAGIPAYWIIDLKNRQVEIHGEPGPSGYQTIQIVKADGQLELVIGGIHLGSICVGDLLPRRRS
jgi:Uma2 family endonuclease